MMIDCRTLSETISSKWRRRHPRKSVVGRWCELAVRMLDRSSMVTERSIASGSVAPLMTSCWVLGPRRCFFFFSPRRGVCEDGARVCEDDALERRRGLDDDQDTNVARRVRCGGVAVFALEATGRASDIVGAMSLRLERALYELSNDDRARPSRATAERRALGLLASGI